MRQADMTVDQVRAEIGTATPFRRETLIYFDALNGTLSPVVRLMVAKLLRRHHRRRIFAMFPAIPRKVIEEISESSNFRQESPSTVRRPRRRLGKGRRTKKKYDLQEISAALESGMSAREIVGRFGISAPYLWVLRCKLLGHAHGTRQVFTADKILQMRKSFDEGKSDREIAALLGCHHKTVRRYRKEMGKA